MPQIAEPITSLKQELELRIEWLEKGLKEIQNKISSEGIKFVNVRELLNITIVYLDGEPTTADEHNKDFIQYRDTGDENVVYMSDINKEIAKEWNRDREERINKENK